MNKRENFLFGLLMDEYAWNDKFGVCHLCVCAEDETKSCDLVEKNDYDLCREKAVAKYRKIIEEMGE